MKKQPFTYVIAPEGCDPSLTPGKKYEVFEIIKIKQKSYSFLFYLDGQLTYSMIKKSLRLHWQDWIIPEIGQWPEGWTEKQKLDAISEPSNGKWPKWPKWPKLAPCHIDHSEELIEKIQRVALEHANDNQGHTPEQLEGGYKIFSICLVMLICLAVFVACERFFVAL